MTVFISYRHTDRDKAVQIQQFLEENSVPTYLDMLDPESQSTNNITSVITKNIGACSHLLAVMSHDTAKSWWVPFEIGEATIANRRITSYQVGNAELPEYLKMWPKMHTPQHLHMFVQAYKADPGNPAMESAKRGIYEALGSTNTAKEAADVFHRNLKSRISRGI